MDVNKKEVFLNSRRLPAYVYSYDGEFLRTDTTTVEAVENRYLLNNGSFALSGASITPIQQSPWLVALKNEKNQMMATKSPFPANVPAEACYMQEIQFVPFQNSALAYTLCNDTVFRVTETGICPACVYDKKNGAEYNEKIADINEMAKDNTNTLSTIELFTFLKLHVISISGLLSCPSRKSAFSSVWINGRENSCLSRSNKISWNCRLDLVMAM